MAYADTTVVQEFSVTTNYVRTHYSLLTVRFPCRNAFAVTRIVVYHNSNSITLYYTILFDTQLHSHIYTFLTIPSKLFKDIEIISVVLAHMSGAQTVQARSERTTQYGPKTKWL
jgi:hypothetical protein